MKEIRFIARSDDAGSSHSANLAIARAAKAGFIKNVSLMAPGAYIEEAARYLNGNKRICFGLHCTLNAEWDKVKWRPVLPAEKCGGLIDENGFFLADPSMFADSRPCAEAAISEISAQLDILTRLGFDVRYIDSHMFAEAYIPGLDEAIEDFAKRKGLLDHMYYYNLPGGFSEMSGNMTRFLRGIPSGQYFYVAHPAVYSEEMLLTGNSGNSGEDIARARAKEAKFLANPLLAPTARLAFGLRTLRYDEAVPLPRRLTVEELIQIMQGRKEEEN